MEQKHFDKKNLLVLLIVILAIAGVALASMLMRRDLNPTLGTLEADPTAAPVATEAPAVPETTAESAPATPANAYLVVTVAGMMYEPIPLYEEGRYTVTRGDMVNVIEVTPESVRMRESSCDNQDCVDQGLVTLENRKQRVLQNMIICLPNEVTLELYTPDELATLLLEMAGYTGEAAQ